MKVPIRGSFKDLQEFLLQQYQPGRHLLAMTWCFPPPTSPSMNSSTSFCLYCSRARRLSYKVSTKGNNFSGVDQNLHMANAINRSSGVCAGQLFKLPFLICSSGCFWASLLEMQRGSARPLKPGTSLQKNKTDPKALFLPHSYLRRGSSAIPGNQLRTCS